jgi:hypothetical protein
MSKEKTELYKACQKFIIDNKISCPKTVSQCDWVMENADEFITDICNIVGYYDHDTNTIVK